MSEQISKEMTFGELMQKHPRAVPVLGKYGLHCIGCHIAVVETIEQGARAHGLNDQELGERIQDLYAAC